MRELVFDYLSEYEELVNSEEETLKNTAVEDNDSGNRYVECMKQFFNLQQSETIKIPNQDKINRFEKLLKVLPKLANENSAEVKVVYSDDELDIKIIITSDIFVADYTTSSTTLTGKVFSHLFSEYPCYLLQIKDDKYLQFSFDICLYDIGENKELDEKLHLLNEKMKAISREDRNK